MPRGIEFLMRLQSVKIGLLLCSVLTLLSLNACSRAQGDPAAEAPPPANVVSGADVNLFAVDHPEQFPVAAAVGRATAPELVVTGAVNPDIARNVPVISLASGRVVGIYARLGDTVQKGQLLLRVRSDDVSGGFSDYRKAVADEALARAQLERAKICTSTAPRRRPILRSPRTPKTRPKSTSKPRQSISGCSAMIPAK